MAWGLLKPIDAKEIVKNAPDEPILLETTSSEFEFKCKHDILREYTIRFRIGKKLPNTHNDNDPAYIEVLSGGIFSINGKIFTGRRILFHNDKIWVSNVNIFQYEDLQKWIPEGLEDTNYHFVKQIGGGNFASVYLVHCPKRLQSYAIKCLHKRSIDSAQSAIENYEAEILRKLEHSCITKLIQYFVLPPTKLKYNTIVLELELLNGGNLLQRIEREREKRLPEHFCKLYFYQIGQAIDHLHSRQVTHRNIQPTNILLKTNHGKTIVKLVDFGIAKWNDQMRMRFGNQIYAAPEINCDENKPYTEKVDIWSMGVCLFAALSGILPSDNNETYKRISKGLLNLESPVGINISSESRDIIRFILKIDATVRPSIKNLLCQSWFCDEKLFRDAQSLIKAEEKENLLKSSPVPDRRQRGPG